MVDTITRRMTFEEFIHLPEEDIRYELVDGEWAPLMPPTLDHGFVQSHLSHHLLVHLGPGFKGYVGSEVDCPTIPFHARRPDLVYIAPDHFSSEDRKRGYPTRPPDLLAEVVSAGDENRDYQEKLSEYAKAGVANYWILDPARRTIETYALARDGYQLVDRFSAGDALTSPLFPGLSIPVELLFLPV